MNKIDIDEQVSKEIHKIAQRQYNNKLSLDILEIFVAGMNFGLGAKYDKDFGDALEVYLLNYYDER